MRAFVIITKKSDWISNIALNYTQLNFDYCMANRINKPDFEFIITNDANLVNIYRYEYVIIVDSGTILPYTYYEEWIHDKIKKSDAEYIDFKDTPTVTIVKPGGKGREELTLNWALPFIDPSSTDTFSATHESAINLLLKNSNTCYIMHNEIPTPESFNKEIEWAMTLSSGFYINYILHNNGFKDDANIHHIDISKPSLRIRRYTIEHWDGQDFNLWVEHLHEKFPLLNMFSKSISSQCLEHMEQTFDTNWLEHWKKYKQCNHYYHLCNFNDNKSLINILNKHHPGNKVSTFWWDGALKRLPGNILKTSEQSFQSVKTFLTTLSNYNSNMIVYGSDHCNNEYNGITVNKAIKKTMHNSRDSLWKLI